MELNFYTLCVIYLVYSFLGWVAETVVATIKGRALDRKSTRLNSSHMPKSRMPSSA